MVQFVKQDDVAEKESRVERKIEWHNVAHHLFLPSVLPASSLMGLISATYANHMQHPKDDKAQYN